MLIPAAQQLTARNQGTAAFDVDDYYGAGIRNGVLVREGDNLVVEKRPGFDIALSGGLYPPIDTGDAILGGGSEGTYPVYFVYDASTVNNKVYIGSTLAATLALTGVPYDKAHFNTFDGTIMLLVNPGITNGAGGYIVTPAAGTCAIIADADFPDDIAYGSAVLNGRAYVGSRDSGETGRIYGSADGDLTTWGALDYLTAGRNPDPLAAIERISDHVIAFGQNTIELFYDAGNPSGSPLSRREDMFFNIGVEHLYGTKSFAKHAGDIYFVGRTYADNADHEGNIGVYVMMNSLQIRRISTSAVDSLLIKYKHAWGCVIALRRHTGPVYLLTLAPDISMLSPKMTLAYDINNDFWSLWSYAGEDYFFASCCVSSELPPLTGQSIALRNGTMLRGSGDQPVSDNMNTFLDGAYMDGATGVWTGGANYPFKVRTRAENHGSSKSKFYDELSVIGDYCTTGDWSVRYSDDDYRTWSTARTMSATAWRKLVNLGKSPKRAWELSVTAETPARVEALDVGVREGLT